MKLSKYNVWVAHGGYEYVYNSFSGALLRLTGEEKTTLTQVVSQRPSSAIRTQLPHNLKLDLERAHVVIPEDFDELAALEERFNYGVSNSDCFSLTIITSLSCNFDCPYCYELKLPQVIPLRVANGVIELVKQNAPNVSKVQIHWLGGEPLIGRKQIEYISKQLLAICAEHEVEYTSYITTNGSLLTREVANTLTSLGVKRAQVTLDGPPEVHDRMRPAVGGNGTFWGIIDNLKAVVDILPIVIRMNIDNNNALAADALFSILKRHGLADRVEIYAGHLVKVDDGIGQPSATYHSSCFTTKEFSSYEIAFNQKAIEAGFSTRILDSPILTPCMAMRRKEYVVGARGELYKCWKSVGTPHETVGSLPLEQKGIAQSKCQESNERKWLDYSPFTNRECRECIALPVCMGGCARLALDPLLYPDRCNTFRFEHVERVTQFVENAVSK